MTKPVASFLLAFAALCFAVTIARAQSVRWEPAAGTLAHNQFSELGLVFEQCEPKGSVTIPSVPGITFGTPNRNETSAFTIINGQASRRRTVTLTYRVRPTTRDPITIPAFSVETDQGRQQVASVTFDVGDLTIGQTGRTTDEIARSRFTVPPRAVWAGEVFPLAYTLNASRNYLYNIVKDFEWDTAPLSIEPWQEPKQVETVLNNEPRISIIYNTRAYVPTAGDYALHSATQLVNINAGPSPFGMFSRTRIEQIAVTSPRVDLTVKPLPAPAPATFKNAVGQFTLTSNVVPSTAAVGEPVTWTLTLDGTGNWPDIPGLPSRPVSKDFTPINPQAKRVNKEGKLFDATLTEDVILIPTKPGRYTLGPVSYTFFNPATGAYETLTTEAVTVQITGGGAGVASTSSPDASSTPSASDVSSGDKPAPSRPVASVPAPSPIPRDPLPAAGAVFTPLARPALLGALLSAVALPLFVWFGLALRRARATDPARPRREARIRLSNTLARLASASAGTASLLQAWQRDTAILWGLTEAVPTEHSFRSASDLASAAAWSALWAEADRTLYGDSPLPADWSARAAAALAAHRTPGFSVFQLFLPRNLLPVLIALASFAGVASALPAQSVEGEKQPASDPPAAYAAGNFTAAADAWTSALKAEPTDWTAHHNLALALIQQNRPSEAAGHALAAFVQQPQNPSVRWHLNYAFKSAGLSPVAIKPFLEQTPAGLLARVASPARWQFVFIGAAWLAALAIALSLWAAYHKRAVGAADRGASRILRHGAFRAMCAGVALILATTASIALHTYGTLADTRAVIVVTPTVLRSIPTDLDTQKTSTLSAGALAVTDKAFLGWRRLVFADGQTGWVRTETLVPLWNNLDAFEAR